MLIGLVLSFSAFSQPIVRGKVIDENGEPLTGATVFIKDNHTIGTITDFDGNFSLTLPGTSPTVIVISFISYVTIEDTVDPERNEVLIRNYVMVPATVEIEDVVVTAKANRSNDVYMQLKKMKSAVSMDFISSEIIRKTGDSDIHEATKRVTGVSTVGSFITVRGLADRYIKTMINGLRVPTLDPYTNNLKLDLFPTSLVDNIVITKTMTPDLPGDWSGAYLSIETKDYPEKLTISVGTTFGYNSQTSFRDIVTTPVGPTDWLGFDNGFRDQVYPFPGLEAFPGYAPLNTLSPYRQFEALGLGDYLASLGVEPTSDFFTEQSIYYRMALVEMNLLPPALIYDNAVFIDARTRFKADYTAEIYRTVNTINEEFGSRLPSNMGTVYRPAPLDFSQEFSIGNQVQLFGRPLGFIFGLRYYRSTNYDSLAYSNRYLYSTFGNELYPEEYLNQQISEQSHGWNSLMQLSYKLNRNNSLSLMFMPNLVGQNNAMNAIDSIPDAEGKKYRQSQLYEQRRQFVYQLKTNHYFPSFGGRMDIHASYTDGFSSIPDFKDFFYFYDQTAAVPFFTFPNTGYPNRYFRYLNEDIYDAKFDLEIPFLEKPNLPRKIKVGGAYLYNTWDLELYQIYIQGQPLSDTIPNGDIDLFFSRDKFGVQGNGEAQLYYEMEDDLATFARNIRTGLNEIISGYAMVDYTILPRLRLAGGLRVETTRLISDGTIFEQYSEADSASVRILRENSGVGGGEDVIPNNKTELIDLHPLPSANLIFKLVENDRMNVNVRLNYSRSIARPSIREASFAYVYDYELRDPVLGNPGLKIVNVNNYDFRIEAFFANNDNVSLSVFHKDFENHIQAIQRFGFYSWTNAAEATINGIELEGRKAFLRNFEIRANVTLIESEAVVLLEGYNDRLDTINMFGQAPYVLNGLLSYQSDKLGLSASIGYNVQGPRLASIGSAEDNIPDVYEMPQQLLDLKISKDLGKHFSISFKARNLLNAPKVRAYEFEEFRFIYDSYRFGTDYRLSISYSL